MISKLKKFLVEWSLNHANCMWNTEDRVKILIQTSRKFNKDFWESKFTQHQKEFTIPAEIIYSKNQFSFTKNFRQADYCFCFGLNRYLDYRESKVKLIFIGQSGLDSIKFQTLPDSILLRSAAGITSSSIAEYALTYSLLMLNRYDVGIKLFMKRKWKQQPFFENNRISFKDQIIGILGVGNNGRESARLFSNISKEIFGCDTNHDKNFKFINKWFLPNEIDNFISSIDILIICLPLLENTRNLINLELLKKAKKNLILINTSRGKIIDEDDLYIALKSKIIRAAVLDTTSREPYPRFGKLWRLKNIIITPHISGNINFYRDDIAEMFFKEILKMEQ